MVGHADRIASHLATTDQWVSGPQGGQERNERGGRYRTYRASPIRRATNFF
jgi:hypothetical protein